MTAKHWQTLRFCVTKWCNDRRHTGTHWWERMAAAELLRVLFADTDGSETFCHSATKGSIPLERWHLDHLSARCWQSSGHMVMSHKSNSVELVGPLSFADIYSRSRSSRAFERRKTGFPPFVNSKTVDSWWITALFDLKLLNMLNILF